MLNFKVEFRNPYDRVGMRAVYVIAPDNAAAEQAVRDHYPNAECLEVWKQPLRMEALIIHESAQKHFVGKVSNRYEVT
jgi:hypothetical protein